jgi:Cyclin M transmembrane N-terminal domain
LLDLASPVRNPPRENVMSFLSDVWIWLGIVACVVQSALFSGFNLAIFSFTQLHLQVMADSGDADAERMLVLRKNSNQVLATIIWGNVSTNVLLTLLSSSVLTGLVAFFFSAVVTIRNPQTFAAKYRKETATPSARGRAQAGVQRPSARSSRSRSRRSPVGCALGAAQTSCRS